MSNMRNMERTLKALANNRRLLILRHLAKVGSATVGELAGLNRIAMGSTSRHLSILKGVELIDQEQKSVEMYYHLTADGRRLLNKLLTIF